MQHLSRARCPHQLLAARQKLQKYQRPRRTGSRFGSHQHNPQLIVTGHCDEVYTPWHPSEKESIPTVMMTSRCPMILQMPDLPASSRRRTGNLNLAKGVENHRQRDLPRPWLSLVPLVAVPGIAWHRHQLHFNRHLKSAEAMLNPCANPEGARYERAKAKKHQ
jgi:hypothetical protein